MTQDELILEVLTLLGASASGQAPSAEDAERVRVRIRPSIEELKGRGSWWWPDDDAFPDAASLGLARYVAANAAVAFGLPDPGRAARDSIAVELRIVTRDAMAPNEIAGGFY